MGKQGAVARIAALIVVVLILVPSSSFAQFEPEPKPSKESAPPPAPQLPDLAGQLMPPLEAGRGDAVRVTGRIGNGGETSSATTLQVRTEGRSQTTIATIDVPALARHEQFDFNFSWHPSPGLWRLSLVIDPDGTIEEGNEENNGDATWVHRAHPAPVERPPQVRFENQGGRNAPAADWEFDERAEGITFRIKPRDAETTTALIDLEWLESRLGFVAAENATFKTVARPDGEYAAVTIAGPEGIELRFRGGQPELGRGAFGRGALSSVFLDERPMNVGLVDIPREETETMTATNDNGTVEVPIRHWNSKLILDFDDQNHQGQPVWVHADWLATFNITNPLFEHEDGSRVLATQRGDYWLLKPTHFSLISAFNNGLQEMYERVVSPDPTFSDASVVNLAGDGEIYIKADRRDTKDETILRDFIAPSSYLVLADLRVANQGHWQAAYPLALGNRAERTNPTTGDFYSAPKSMGFYYYSRDEAVGSTDPNSHPQVQAYYRTAAGTKVTLWTWTSTSAGMREGWTALLRISVGTTCTEFHIINNGNWYNPAGCVSNSLLPLADIDSIFHGSEEFTPDTSENVAELYIDQISASQSQGNHIDTNFDTTTGWTLSGSATCCTGGYLQLTSATASQAGRAYFNTGLSASRFSVEFNMYSGPNTGTGADGMTMFFYKNTSYTPTGGGSLGFQDLDTTTNSGHQGYGLEFDGYQNVEHGDPNDQHVALIQNNVATHIQPITNFQFEGGCNPGCYHAVNLEVFETKMFVYIDGYYQNTIPHSFSRTQSGFGFSAGTGGLSNYHRIDYVRVSVPAAAPPPPPTGCETPGPDASGYTCAGITASLTDISSTGTDVFLSDDQVSGAVPIGFSFNFYGTAYTSAYISSNGFLTFTGSGSNGCCSGQTLPNAAEPNNLIAGYWEDLNPSMGGQIDYKTIGSSPNRKFITQWSWVPHYGVSDALTFQIVLIEGSNNIEVHGSSAPTDGGYHVTGVENSAGNRGLRFKSGDYSLSNLGVRFTAGTPAPNQPPNVPSNPSPPSGSTGHPISLTVSWTGGDPDTGQSVTYQVFVSTTNPPPTTTPVSGCNQISSTSCALSGLQFATTYHWIVRASDGALTSQNAAWQFSTSANRAPNAATNPNPATGSTARPTSLTVTWTNGGDPDGQPVTFTVYRGTSNPPTTAITGCIGIIATSCNFLLDLGITYHWKVSTSDGTLSTDSSVWSFTTNYRPNTPSNPSPANGATNVLWTVSGSWTGGDPDAGQTVTYTVFRRQGTSGSFTQICQVTSPSCSLGTGLVRGVTYQWFVRATDTMSAWIDGPTWGFTTKANSPPGSINCFGTSGSFVTVTATWNGNCNDPDGDSLTYTWNWGDSTPTSGGSSATHTYKYPWCPGPSNPTIALTVTDGFGGTGGSSSSSWTALDTRDNDGDGLKTCLEEETNQQTDPLVRDTDGDSVGEGHIETIAGIQYSRGSDYVESPFWNGRQDLFCPAAATAPNCAPNPRHKDLYVELDYMQDTTTSGTAAQHMPSIATLGEIVAYFANAPGVTNPDGTGGITLHLDAGTYGGTNYNLGGGNAVTHDRDLGTWASTNTCTNLAGCGDRAFGEVISCNGYSFQEFFNIKNNVNAGGGNFDYQRRARTYHYMIFAHYLGDVTNCWVSGIARMPGRDFIVTLAQTGLPNNGNHEHGLQEYRKSTFMHEFGHALGLDHGGRGDGTNNKPNYLSVMNYAHQFNGILHDDGTPAYYGYSGAQLPNLDENALDERIGIAHAYAENKHIRYFCTPVGSTAPVHTTSPLDGQGNLNWDCDKVLTNPNQDNIEASVAVDINNDGVRGILNGALHDWANLVYTGIQTTSAPGDRAPTPFDPLPPEWLRELGLQVCTTDGFTHYCPLPKGLE